MKKRMFLGASLAALSGTALAQEFHEDLKLAQDQETAWQRYADSVRAIAADRARALYQALAPEQQKMADPRLVNLVLEAAGQSAAQIRRLS